MYSTFIFISSFPSFPTGLQIFSVISWQIQMQIVFAISQFARFLHKLLTGRCCETN